MKEDLWGVAMFVIWPISTTQTNKARTNNHNNPKKPKLAASFEVIMTRRNPCWRSKVSHRNEETSRDVLPLKFFVPNISDCKSHIKF